MATGNFRTVSGQPRTRLFVADLAGSQATLNPWYYDEFATGCNATTANDARRIAYLQGVDYSPDGSYFVVTATGRVSQPGDEGVTVCDATARFDLDNDQAPVWINYTGGDSVWSTAVTGAAVYVQGHFRWLNSINGFASTCPPATDTEGCVVRKGVGAIDPQTGRALSWNPPKPAQISGEQFLATQTGLWIASDSRLIAGEDRRGLTFMPLP